MCDLSIGGKPGAERRQRKLELVVAGQLTELVDDAQGERKIRRGQTRGDLSPGPRICGTRRSRRARLQRRSASSIARASMGAFVMTFVAPIAPHDDDPRYDLDMSSFALVKTYADGRHGTTYADMPWEPKEAFRAVADYYANH